MWFQAGEGELGLGWSCSAVLVSSCQDCHSRGLVFTEYPRWLSFGCCCTLQGQRFPMCCALTIGVSQTSLEHGTWHYNVPLQMHTHSGDTPLKPLAECLSLVAQCLEPPKDLFVVVRVFENMVYSEQWRLSGLGLFKHSWQLDLLSPSIPWNLHCTGNEKGKAPVASCELLARNFRNPIINYVNTSFT